MTDVIRALIVEDLPTDAELNENEVRQVLPASEFLRVETREDFLSALESFRPDVILSDYKLPHFDGMAALKLAQEHSSEVPFIIITGSMNEDTAVECMKAGAWDYVIKDHLKRLGPAVLNAMEQKQSRLERKRAEDEHFSHFRFLESLERVDQAIRRTDDLERTLMDVLDTALSIFDSDRAWLIYPCDPEAPAWHVHMERTRPEYPGAFGNEIDLPTTPDVRQVFLEMLNSSSPVIYDPRSGRALPEVSRRFNAQSQIQTAVYPKMGKPWIFGMHQCSNARVWSDHDARLFTEIARRIADSLSSLLFLKDLRESEARLRTLVKTIPDLVWLKDINGVYLACNPMFERLYGAKEADILGNTDYDFVGRELADFFRMHDRKAMEAGKPSSNEEWLTFADDGHRALMETVKTPMYDAGGKITGVLGIARDITDRTRMEEALRESEKRYRSLFDNMLEGVAYCKLILTEGRVRDFVYLKVNNAFERLTGLRDVVGKKITELIPGIQETNPELFEIYGRVASTGTPERFETCSNAFGGWLSISVYSTEKEHFVAVFDNITERKKAEEKLRENESRLRTLLKTIPDMVWLKDINGVYLACNPVFERFFGAREADIIGKTDYDFVSRELADVFREHDRKAMAAGKPSSQEDWITFAYDGHRALMDTIKTPMYDAGGNPVGVLGIARDITDRKQAEEDIRFKNAILATQQETAIDGILLVDGEGQILNYNRRFVDMWGLAAEVVETRHDEKVLQSVLDRVEYPEEFLRKVKHLYKVREERSRDEIALKDGRMFDRYSAPMVSSDGKYYGRIWYFRDITERKQAEVALAASEAQFRKLYQEFHGLLDAVPDSLMLLDRDMKVVWANRVAADSLGGTAEAITGQYCHSLWYNQATPCDPCPVMESFSTGRPVSETITRPDGRVWDIRTVPLIDEGGSIVRVIEVVREVTEHRKLEAQYLQSQKMESIGTLAGGVAHDFNNILSAIIGYGHVTLMDMTGDDPKRMNIEHILEAADRAARLTKELLLFSRKQVTERKSVDLNEVVNTVQKFLRMVIGEDITCKTMLQERPLPVYADSHQLEQVLMNLATNARDAMSGGGALTIKTEQIDLTEDFTRAHGYGKSGPYAMITISDTGAGMDEATQKHIFEPFFTTKEVGKGTGLGLAVVYGIIKQHDGYINAYSEPGRGTTFRIYLPLIASKADEKTVPLLEYAPVRGTETVLLAEDDKSLRVLSGRLLAEFGYTIIEAVDGEEAVKKFMENKDAIQLLLFDLVMPKMNGKEASDEIKKMKPDMKVLFASGYDPDFLQQKGLLGEGVHLIYKPISPMDLLRKVRSVLDG